MTHPRTIAISLFLPALALALPSAAAQDANRPGAGAAPVAPKPVLPPAIAGLVGYRHPAVEPSDCRLVNAGRRDCIIPGRTVGAYVIKASGRSMPFGANPRQQLTIIVANRNCAQAVNFKAWAGTTRTISARCEVTVLADAPLVVSVVYADLQALKEASGPEVVIERVAWSGVIDMRDVTPAQP